MYLDFSNGPERTAMCTSGDNIGMNIDTKMYDETVATRQSKIILPGKKYLLREQMDFMGEVYY